MGAELPVISFIATVLALIPLPRYWRARNIPILFTIAWLAICNLSSGVNSIVWASNVVIQLQVWCDITMKLMIGASIGLSAALVCICRRLSQAASPRYAKEDAAAKRRRTIFELVMCIGLPITTMALHVIVQANRFVILEDFGCQPYIFLSTPAILIIYVPPFMLSLAVAYFAVITICAFHRRRSQFLTGLHPSGLNHRKYYRLIALCVVETFCVVGMAVYTLVSNIKSVGLQDWVSWPYVHANWRRIDQIIRLLTTSDFWGNVLATWTIFPMCSVVFFAFFAFGESANAEYHGAIYWVKTHVFRIKAKANPVLPVFTHTGAPTLNLTETTPTTIALETITTVSGDEKWDDIPTPPFTTSRPASPPHDEHKGAAISEVSL